MSKVIFERDKLATIRIERAARAMFGGGPFARCLIRCALRPAGSIRLIALLTVWSTTAPHL